MQQVYPSTSSKDIFLAVFVVGLAGCAALPAPPSHLALAYLPHRVTTYRMLSESTRSVEWQGLSAQASEQLQGGTSGRILDLTVTETVVQTDPNGHAILDIRIDRLAYKGFSGGDLSLDYDSRRTNNEPSALASLVGASYRIEVDKWGKALRVVKPFTLPSSLEPEIPHLSIARGLISERAILSRHSMSPFSGMSKSDKPLTAWSVTRNFAFGSLGAKTFDKTYTVKEVKTVNGIPIAFIEMKAVPTSDSSEGPLGSLLSSEENYDGELQFDLSAGQIAMWQETLEVTWRFVEPTTANSNQTQPRSGLMTARQAVLIQRMVSDEQH